MKHHRIFSTNPKSADLATPEISTTVQFWLLLIFGVPSLICSLFLFYQYLSNRTRRNALHNHPILVLLLANILLIITDFSWMLDSLRSGHVLSATPAFCMIWWFLDFSLYNSQTLILAWGSIERHILIFHSKLIRTRNKKICFHYLPPTILIIYLFSFYIGVIFLPSCNNTFSFTSVECGSNPCYLGIEFLALWDSIVHSVIPTFITAIFSIALLYRIIAQKKRLHQPIHWRKYRLMSLQLLSLSAVYLFLNFPLTIIMLVQLTRQKESQLGFGTQLYVFFLTYSITLVLPFVIGLNYLSHDRHRSVTPMLTNIQHHRMYTRDTANIKLKKLS